MPQEPTPTDSPESKTPLLGSAAPTVSSGDDPQGSDSNPQGLGAQKTTQEPDWREQFIPEDIRGEAVFANVKDPQDLAKQFYNAQKVIGRDKIPMPKDESDQEGWDRLFKAVGRPDSPDEYEIPEDLKEVQWDEQALKDFKAAFHGAGLSKKQFAIATKKYADYVNAKMQEQQAKTQQKITEGLTALQKEWGPEYSKRMELANGAFQSVADDDLKELIASNPELANHPSVLKLFAKIGASMQEHDLKLDGKPVGFNPDSPVHAKQKLAEFEEANREIIFDVMGKYDPKKREEVLAERWRLTRLAYPPE